MYSVSTMTAAHAAASLPVPLSIELNKQKGASPDGAAPLPDES
jgi:hypothetical protein